MERLGCCLLLLLLLLLCSCPTALGGPLDDYDDYAANATREEEEEEEEDARPALQNPLLCPRAIPAKKVTVGNTTFLVLSAASRAQLRGPLTVLLLPAFYSLVFLVGLLANALALWVLATRVEKLPSTVFLMNLAAADLLLGLLLPLKIAYYFLGNHWPFGEGPCRLTTAAFYGNMYCSLLLLAAISVDRYLAVAHPFLARACRSPAFAAGTCAGAWLAAALATLPLAFLRQSFPLAGGGRPPQVLCHDALPQEEDAQLFRPYFVALATCGFLLPLLVMACSCGATLRVLLGSGQRYATAIKLTALVLLSAVAFFAPSNVLLLLHYSGWGCPGRRASLYLAYMGSLALGAANSCLDPFVYYYVSADFREKVRGRLFGRRKGSAVSLKTSKETLPRKSCPSETLTA